MKKLNGFNKSNKKRNFIVISTFLFLSLLLVGISYAVYQKTDEIQFINAKVGSFDTSNSDIELAMTLDGEDIDTPPSKDNYNVVVECDYADGVWESTDDRWGAYIYNINSNRVKCNVNFKTLEPILSEITITSAKTSIDLNYTIEGIVTNITCKYGIEENSYIKDVDDVTNTNCNIKNLEMDTMYYYQVCARNGGGESCKEGEIKTRPLIDIGDYIKMTPTATSYIPSASITGYTSGLVEYYNEIGTRVSYTVQKALNPSELNEWVVIKKNEDGTIDAVSRYVSSVPVWIGTRVGYTNLVGTLNTIASQYTNIKYVSKTRHMGYSNQIEKCTTLSSSACPTDTGYITDYDLVKTALGNSTSGMIGYGANSIGSAVCYWLPGRRWYGSSSLYVGFVDRTTGIYDSKWIGDSGSTAGHGRACSVRPVITLLPVSSVTGGSGTSISPYTLP